jgi:membrane fusion protein, multidrug efflux system
MLFPRFARLSPAVALLMLGSLTLISCGKSDGRTAARAGSGKAGVPVEVLVLQPQHLDNNIVTTGSLMANEEVELRSELSGRVTGLYFQEGKRVKQGDLLLRTNDRELKAQLKRNEAQEKQAGDEEARKAKLLELKSISQEEYDIALNTLHMAQADREATQAQLAETEIKAPFDGIIGLRHISEGGYVTPDIVAATMQDIDPVKVEFSVPEKYASQIKNGTPILARIGQSPEGNQGVVYAVESKIDAGTRTIKARAKVPNPSGLLIPGSFAKVEISLEQLDSAIVVPSGAIVPDINGESVFLFKGGKAKVVPIKTGIRTETGVQVLDGLTRNDTLIVTGLLQVADGKPVQIRGAQSR